MPFLKRALSWPPKVFQHAYCFLLYHVFTKHHVTFTTWCCDAVCSQPYQKTLGWTPSIHDKCTGFFYVHYTTQGSHLKDEPITVKCPDQDSSPHSANRKHQSLSPAVDFTKSLGLLLSRVNLGLILRSACYSAWLGIVLSPKISLKLGRVLWNLIELLGHDTTDTTNRS